MLAALRGNGERILRNLVMIWSITVAPALSRRTAE
jgi:hypothetical protein